MATPALLFQLPPARFYNHHRPVCIPPCRTPAFLRHSHFCTTSRSARARIRPTVVRCEVDGRPHGGGEEDSENSNKDLEHVVQHVDDLCLTGRQQEERAMDLDTIGRERMADELFLASQRLRLRQERVPLKRTVYRPFCTCVIIAANLGIHWLQRAYKQSHRHASLVRRLPDLSRLFAKESTKVLQHRQWYRLITAAFLHINCAHLLFNCGTLYAIGSGAETLFGAWAYLCIYLGGAISGNVFSVLASMTSIRRSMGCSGGVFAVIGAVCVHLEKNKAFIGPMARRSLKAVGVAVVANLVGGWVMPSVDGWAHFGGCAFGAAAGTWLVPSVRTQSGGGESGAAVVNVRRVGWKQVAVVWTVMWAVVMLLLTKVAS